MHVCHHTVPKPGDITRQEVNSFVNDPSSIMVVLTGKVRVFEHVFACNFRQGSTCSNSIDGLSINPAAGKVQLPVMNCRISDSVNVIRLSSLVVKSRSLLSISLASIASKYREKFNAIASSHALLLLPRGENL